ncbi:hypothetical protein ABPG77_004759 [Micractinium sp. CCAP 211/92]
MSSDCHEPDVQGLPPCSFYLHSPARSKLSALFGSFKERDTEQRIRALLRSTSDQRDSSAHSAAGSNGVTTGKAAASLAAPTALAAGAINDSPATYQLGGGAALVVRFGLCEVAGLGLHHLAPNLHHEPSTRTACVFSGHLQNLDELADRYASEAYAEGPTSPSSILAARGDPRQLAAETLLHMYLKERGGDLLVLLSELQGQYAFVLFDGEKRQVFAARDSSGGEPLFYCLDEDGAVSLSNTTPHVPTDDGAVQWQELPPGHFISGRSPKLQQFALTPAQLSIRESYERSMDEEMSPRALGLLAGRHDDHLRRSLSPDAADDDAFFVF